MEGLVSGLGGLIGDFAQQGVARFSFDDDLEGAAARAQKEIPFPMSWLLAGVGLRRSLVDGNTVGDGDFNPRDAWAVSATSVAANKRRDEVSGVGVDPLVNGFMAHHGKVCLWVRG